METKPGEKTTGVYSTVCNSQELDLDFHGATTAVL